jgi:hypothetical protein
MWKSLKRWPVLLALLVGLSELAVGLLFLPYPGSRVTRENCQRIKLGMTEAEVRAILGKPWDDSLLDPEDPPSDLVWGQGYCWTSGSVIMIVFFDENGRVIFADMHSDPDRPRSWLPARIWRRLRSRMGGESMWKSLAPVVVLGGLTVGLVFLLSRSRGIRETIPPIRQRGRDSAAGRDIHEKLIRQSARICESRRKWLPLRFWLRVREDPTVLICTCVLVGLIAGLLVTIVWNAGGFAASDGGLTAVRRMRMIHWDEGFTGVILLFCILTATTTYVLVTRLWYQEGMVEPEPRHPPVVPNIRIALTPARIAIHLALGPQARFFGDGCVPAWAGEGSPEGVDARLREAGV